MEIETNPPILRVLQLRAQHGSHPRAGRCIAIDEYAGRLDQRARACHRIVKLRLVRMKGEGSFWQRDVRGSRCADCQKHQLLDTVPTTPTYKVCCREMSITSRTLSGSIQCPVTAKACQVAENFAPAMYNGATAQLGSHLCNFCSQDQEQPTCRDKRNLRAQSRLQIKRVYRGALRVSTSAGLSTGSYRAPDSVWSSSSRYLEVARLKYNEVDQPFCSRR